jgi:DNA-binding IclR family transcriptional regulator
MTPTPQARAVKLLRALERSIDGHRVRDLAREIGVAVSTVARDLGGIRAAGELLEATGPLDAPRTVVRLRGAR